jgi:putative membrane protein
MVTGSEAVGGETRYLHPASLLFSIGALIREAALILIFALYAARGQSWQIIFLLTLIPTGLMALLRYLSYRYVMGPTELTIEQGVIGKRSRQIPYRKIQNVEQRQGPVHRVLGVAEVQLQTGSGDETEATLKVLSLAAVDELRARIAAGQPESAQRDRAADAAAPMVQLSVTEVVINGVLHGRGYLILGAVFGILWQWGASFGFDPAAWFERVIARRVPNGITPTVMTLAVGVSLLLISLLIVRLLSVVWSLLVLFDFTLRDDGEILRSSHGLISRFASTIPKRRIQLLTIRETPLARHFQRANIRVDTAGGFGDDPVRRASASLVPVIKTERVDEIVRRALLGTQLENSTWRSIDSRAARRMRMRATSYGAILASIGVLLFGPWGAAPGGLWALWQWATAGLAARSAKYALLDGAVAIRRGWWTRYTSVARFDRIQSVMLAETPFDRRWEMKRLQIDTAGVGSGGPKLALPYIPAGVADEIYQTLRTAMTRTELSW